MQSLVLSDFPKLPLAWCFTLCLFSWFILRQATYRGWLRVCASVETQRGVPVCHKVPPGVSDGGGWVLLSLVTCLWAACPRVCDTGGTVGVRCVPAAAPAAGQCPVPSVEQAGTHSRLLCPCFGQCWESQELEFQSKPSGVVPHLLRCFCY